MKPASEPDADLKEIRHRRGRYELRIIEVEIRLEKLKKELKKIIAEEEKVAAAQEEPDASGV